MASTIKVKRSAVQGKAPTTGNLETGELALNTRDGRLYSKGTQVFEVGANNHSLFVGTGGATFANGAYTLPTADGSADQILKTNGSGTLSFTDAGGSSFPFFVGGSSVTTIPISDGVFPFFDGDGNADNIGASSDFVTDTTPQLGGNLDTNGNNINLNDNSKVTFGTSNDLEIFHSGTTSFIRDVGDGDLQIFATDDVYIRGYATNNYMARFNENSYVQLYYNNNLKFSTTVDGIDIEGAGSIKLPVGTTAQRPSLPTAGDLRWNSDDTSAEIYDGSAWGEVGGGGGGASGAGGDAIFYENGQTITTSYTITSSTNAMSTGPLTVNSGVSVTVPSGSRWVVL